MQRRFGYVARVRRNGLPEVRKMKAKIWSEVHGGRRFWRFSIEFADGGWFYGERQSWDEALQIARDHLRLRQSP
jgi:hypothetical protein